MTIYVIGSTGMLGRYVSKYLENESYSFVNPYSPKYKVKRVNRKDLDISDASEQTLQKFFRPIPGDVIINCAGTIKPRVDELGDLNALLVNSVFPHRLANFCKNTGLKMIHITTDCVFSGDKGNYTEEDRHDISDVYGRTKSLGEPSNGTVIRTSIIGEEINQTRSLVEWVKSCKDKNANGFTNHYWNGVTCLQLSKVINEVIDRNMYWDGVRHIHSPDSLDKFELLNTINDVYDLNIDIKSTEADIFCDRTLSSIYNTDIDIPKLKVQIEEMKDFELN